MCPQLQALHKKVHGEEKDSLFRYTNSCGTRPRFQRLTKQVACIPIANSWLRQIWQTVSESLTILENPTIPWSQGIVQRQKYGNRSRHLMSLLAVFNEPVFQSTLQWNNQRGLARNWFLQRLLDMSGQFWSCGFHSCASSVLANHLDTCCAQFHWFLEAIRVPVVPCRNLSL